MLARTGVGRQCALRSTLLPALNRPQPRQVLLCLAGSKDKKHEKEAKHRKDALYLLQWHGAGSQQQQDLPALHDELKVLEKVSKDALWFTVKEAEGGKQHVLMVTNDMKKARKYKLAEITEETGMLQLEGVQEPVTIPVAQLKAALMQGMDSDSSSSSDSDEEMMTMGTTTTTTTSHGKHKPVAQLPPSVEAVAEDPAAQLQAAALLAGSAGMDSKEGAGHKKKLKDIVKDVQQAAGSAASPIPAPAPMLLRQEMHEDSSGSSSSSSGSDSDSDEGDAHKVTQAPTVPAAQ